MAAPGVYRARGVDVGKIWLEFACSSVRRGDRGGGVSWSCEAVILVFCTEACRFVIFLERL